MPEQESSFDRLWRNIRNYLHLKTEDIKLTLSEKITVLVSTFVVVAAMALLAGIVLLFLTLAAANWIGEALGMAWAYLIIAGGYLIFMILAVVFRRQLIINPVARFVTRLILS